MYLSYRSEYTNDYNIYLLAIEKGMRCTGINYHTGIAEFDPNYPAQEKPKCVSFKVAMKRLNTSKEQ
jgi:hypothetical protein